MMVGAAVPAPVVTGALPEAGRGAAVSGDGSTVAETPDTGTRTIGDPPPSAFAAVLAGLMLAPVVPPPVPSSEPGPGVGGSVPEAGGVPDLPPEEPVRSDSPGRSTGQGRGDPVRSPVAEAVLATLLAFRPGHVEGQAVAAAARTPMSMPPIPAAVAGEVIEEPMVAPPSAPQSAEISDPGDAEGGTPMELSVSGDTVVPEEAVAEHRVPTRRGLESIAAVVRQAMPPVHRTHAAPIAIPPMITAPALVASAVAAEAVSSAGSRRGAGSAVEASPDDGEAGGDAPSRRGTIAPMPFAFGGPAPHAPRALAAVSAPAAPSPVADVSPPPPTGSPSQATVDLALGDGVSGRVRIAVRGEVIHATILADASHAALLQNELPALRRALREHGFQEAHLTVRVPPATAAEVPTPRREAAHPDPGGRDARPDQRPFTDDDRPRDRRRHPTEEEFS